MSGQYSEEDERRDVARADELVETIGSSSATIEALVREYEQAVAPLKAKLDEDTEVIQQSRDQALEELSGIMERMMNERAITGKSIPLRSGVVSVRTTSSLDVLDEPLLRKKMRAFGVLLQAFVPQVPRYKLDKKMLARFFKTTRGRAVQAKLGDAVRTKQTTRMTVKPVRVQTELRRDLNPLRITMPS